MESLVSIIDDFRDFCNRHKQIKRFEFEYEEQLPNLSTEGKTFPFVFITPLYLELNGSMINYTIRVFVFNRIDRDRTNILDSTSDTSLIMIDILKWWNEDGDGDIMIENDPYMEALNNEHLDYLQGWQADIVFSIPSYSRCDIPIKNN